MEKKKRGEVLRESAVKEEWGTACPKASARGGKQGKKRQRLCGILFPILNKEGKNF